MNKKIKLILEGIRIQNVVIALFCCFVAINKIGVFEFNVAILSVVIVVSLMMAANLANDVYDVHTDSINCPSRPLIIEPSMIVFFKRLVVFFCLISIVLSFFLNLKSQLIIIFSIPVLVFYSKLFKPIPLIGNIIVALYLSLVFIFIEVSITGYLSKMVIPSIFAFGISLIRELLKDVEDFIGDKKTGLKTVPVVFGIINAIYIGCFFIMLFCLQCFIIILDSNIYSVMAIIFLVFLPLFYLIFLLLENPSIKSCKEGSFLLKKITIAGLLIIYII
ncbi:MAG: hypothetical protein CMG00_09375 [Candidatus Marinimicrobia bacterium]|nr:hypothetical protein [Candidatus Neomarinimicrobiota bacterium]|tara:strand:+ start:19671 stop:20498 length:828 start_codon:yes stop_codon:yes gene_type:complete